MQARFHPAQVKIVAETRFQRYSADPRLIGVDLPWMEIENARLTVTLIDAPQAQARHDIGEEAKISATAARHILAEDAHGGQWYLEKAVLARMKGEPRSSWNPVVVVQNRVDARAVFVALLGQDRQSPKRVLGDGETCRPIAPYGRSADILQEPLGSLDIASKRLRLVLENRNVLVAMACELVPLVNDPTDQTAMTLGNPTKREKSGLDIMLSEESEDLVRIALDAAGPRLPACPVDSTGKCLYLKKILDVYRHGIGTRDAGPEHHRGRRLGAIAGTTIAQRCAAEIVRSPHHAETSLAETSSSPAFGRFRY